MLPDLNLGLGNSLKNEYNQMTATGHLSSQHALQQNGQRVLDWLFPPEVLLLSRALMPTFEPRDEAKAFLFYTDNIRKKQLHGFRWQMSVVQLVI